VIEIRDLVAADWPAVAAIYAQGLDVATFEETVPGWPDWDAGHLAAPRLVAAAGTAVGDIAVSDTVVGWVAVAPTSSRECYRGVVGNSIYVAREQRGRGIGRLLLSELGRRTDELGIWTIQAGIFVENEASIALHAACGFRIVGTRERLARKRGTWRDVVLMERRSALV
jgi:L-amino acid N-acyltransferase YncA